MAAITITDPSLQEFTEALLGRPLRPGERDILVVIDRTPNPAPDFIAMQRRVTMASGNQADRVILDYPWLCIPTGVAARDFEVSLYEDEVPVPTVNLPADPPPSHKRNNLDRAAQGREARARMVARAMARRK